MTEKRLDQESRLSIVTEVEHQINCELAGFEGGKGNLWVSPDAANPKAASQTL